MKNEALTDAVRARNHELVDLLLQYGAEVRGVPFIEVLRTWEPSLIRRFLELGADATTGMPFAFAFGDKVRTALRPFVEFRDAHPDIVGQLQEQIDRALRHFCREGDLKWVSLLMWAGANPRSRGPSLYERDDPDLHVSAMEEACFSGRLDVLMRLKPGKESDDLAVLLRSAVLFGSPDMVEKLMQIGAASNDKENGASSAFDTAFERMRFESFRPGEPYRWRGQYAVSKSIGMMRVLAARGAIWCPEDRQQVNAVRRVLFDLDPEVTLEILKLFVEHRAASRETLRTLLDSARMRQHLAKESWWMARLKLKDLVEDPRERMRRARPRTVADIPRSLMMQYNREDLYQQVWQEPMQILARRYGVSDVALAKTCRKLLVPLPGRGYWAKKAAGKRVPPRPKLPG